MGPPVNLFDTQRHRTCRSVSDWIDHKERDVDEPLSVATTELTIQQVDTFPKDEQLRPDRCYHGDMSVSTFLRKTAT